MNQFHRELCKNPGDENRGVKARGPRIQLLGGGIELTTQDPVALMAFRKDVCARCPVGSLDFTLGELVARCYPAGANYKEAICIK